MIDEIDTAFGARAHEDLRAVLNSGHRRGSSVLRVDSSIGVTRSFSTFAPVVLAGLGALPDTVAGRSIIIRMRRRGPDEQLREFRERGARREADPLRERLEAWAESAVPLLKDHRPEMPDGVTDRAADVWEPLIAIADLARGDWPKRSREAAVAFVNTRRASKFQKGRASRPAGRSSSRATETGCPRPSWSQASLGSRRVGGSIRSGWQTSCDHTAYGR